MVKSSVGEVTLGQYGAQLIVVLSLYNPKSGGWMTRKEILSMKILRTEGKESRLIYHPESASNLQNHLKPLIYSKYTTLENNSFRLIETKLKSYTDNRNRKLKRRVWRLKRDMPTSRRIVKNLLMARDAVILERNGSSTRVSVGFYNSEYDELIKLFRTSTYENFIFKTFPVKPGVSYIDFSIESVLKKKEKECREIMEVINKYPEHKDFIKTFIDNKGGKKKRA